MEDHGYTLGRIISEEEGDRKILKFILMPRPFGSFSEKVGFYLKKDILRCGMDYLGYLVKDLKDYVSKKIIKV